ncbi:glycoside hydrolase family 130 protein [Sphingomonas radiodurans]|uniref:glycoside hydrolase family 130 protein n=1 Tax=Sphingomonas radiodurans TaxID=2890321 RepID=UPI001E4E8063|nr:glycoside hydrolase family 130 protein [Sphingomonas radiodurans]WBH17845.1 glycoside hydrolase family 130 protein [Sphingomonas radiodurans]
MPDRLPGAPFVRRLPIELRADPSRVVVRPYVPGADDDHARARRIAARVMALSAAHVADELQGLMRDFGGHETQVKAGFRQRYAEVAGVIALDAPANDTQALLIGAYFSQEYGYEAAALFNPSIVPHPNQSGVPDGAVRFVLSLRAVGEGHVSSIAFRTGICDAAGWIVLAPQGERAVVPVIEDAALGGSRAAGVRMRCDDGLALSEIVIFPSTPAQRNGIEDLRLVRFTEDDGSVAWLGTYTAYSGQGIRQEILRTTDFASFSLDPIRGAAEAGKGMALFPRRLAGRYAMLGRADNETISLAFSDDLYEWPTGPTIIAPRWPWEFVQIGNCGAPIELDEGWLVVTHGVGAMRNYVLGACLLDARDPSRLIARTTRPLIRPDATERKGYVPNVVYSCGAMLHGRTLVLPYAVADSFTTFATMPVDQLLAAMD